MGVPPKPPSSLRSKKRALELLKMQLQKNPGEILELLNAEFCNMLFKFQSTGAVFALLKAIQMMLVWLVFTISGSSFIARVSW
jgi:hypothetical protein